MTKSLESIAIAGAWGYIGRKLLDAALRRGLRVYVYDPGATPDDIDLRDVTRVLDESAFYDLKVDLYHLALHPEARHKGQTILLRRAQSEPLYLLNEKPIAPPETPEIVPPLMASVDGSRSVVLYDFPELFDPLTHKIAEYFTGFRQVEINSIDVERSKDREDPLNPRNHKRMLPIQFQESCHCLAYVVCMLAGRLGGFEEVLAGGVSVEAIAEPYYPPNPADYPYVVDGRCEYRLSLGRMVVNGLTNFKSGAPWRKRRILRGHADGEPFVIDADYLEGKKYLRINGADQGWDPNASSYDAILATLAGWKTAVPRQELLQGVYPNPRVAWLAYQLSAVLWKSSRDRRRIDIPDLPALTTFDSGFKAARSQLPRYIDTAAGRAGHSVYGH